MAMPPPKVLGWPNPMSSMRTRTTLGAPLGAFTSKRGGALALRTSSSVTGSGLGSGTGSTLRSTPSAAAPRSLA